ncbi:MAG: hypothetical protein GXP35_03120, partial [Actinobacteria bacterium]|nr:hypothetical protein [Actinomycetota bacterium]
LAVSLGACSSGASEESLPPVKAELIQVWEINWFSNTGLRANFGDIDVISARIDEACSVDVWVPEVNFELAADFVVADGGDANDLELMLNAARAIWLSASHICGSRFPAGAIELGPPGIFHL